MYIQKDSVSTTLDKLQASLYELEEICNKRNKYTDLGTEQWDGEQLGMFTTLFRSKSVTSHSTPIVPLAVINSLGGDNYEMICNDTTKNIKGKGRIHFYASEVIGSYPNTPNLGRLDAPNSSSQKSCLFPFQPKEVVLLLQKTVNLKH